MTYNYRYFLEKKDTKDTEAGIHGRVQRTDGQAWQHGGKPNRKRLTDIQMLALIQSIHAELKGIYGSPRMVRELRDRRFPASKEWVERLIRENVIRARHKRRYKVTTNSKHNLPIAPNRWIAISILLYLIKSGRLISPIYGQTRAVFIWRSHLICLTVR